MEEKVFYEAPKVAILMMKSEGIICNSRILIDGSNPSDDGSDF